MTRRATCPHCGGVVTARRGQDAADALARHIALSHDPKPVPA